MSVPFPLTAIVGQDALVEALLINAVSPEVGGVLVRGERGTAKSTAVRALAPLLPPVRVAAGQPLAFAPGDLAPDGPVPLDASWEHRPAPLAELPVGATADRLVGAVALADALERRVHAFEPGLLARAHQGVLYVDEVNLLPDHLVDLLLDTAASGVCLVERESVSRRHSARFLLVGTMNPEEGELRPQLLDRFGLGVEVRAPADIGVRTEIVRRRLAFEHDPAAFAARHAENERGLARRIAAARDALPGVRIPDVHLARISQACARLGIDGMRGDIVTARAARVLAAVDGRDEVTFEDVRRAALLALPHRHRRDPLQGDDGLGEQEVEAALGDAPEPDDPPPGGGLGEDGGTGDRPGDERQEAPHGRAPARERMDAPDGSASIDIRPRAGTSGPLGRRARSRGIGTGAIDTRPAGDGASDVAVAASVLRGAAIPGLPGTLEHVRRGREGCLITVVVDASGSMGARRRMARVKGALLGLLRDAYARRDRVGVIAFRDARARVIAPPGTPLEAIARMVSSMPTGGRTPLAEGLREAVAVMTRERRREPARQALCVVITDGRADLDDGVRAAAAALGRAADGVWIVDAEEGPVRLGGGAALAVEAGGELQTLGGGARPGRRAA